MGSTWIVFLSWKVSFLLGWGDLGMNHCPWSQVPEPLSNHQGPEFKGPQRRVAILKLCHGNLLGTMFWLIITYIIYIVCL